MFHKMESLGSKMKEIDEEFCRCPKCLQQYTEPKLLPCLHRCCKDCLKQLIEENQGIPVSCPECKHEFPIPREGVEGFKTDVNLKTTIDCIKLQTQLEDTETKQCCECSNRENVTAYCFKCNGYLCKECYNYHLTKRSLIDHKQHTFSLNDLLSKKVTLEQIAWSRKDRICNRHADSLARLCCQTCNNLPICITCAAGSHKDHTITDVTMLASKERELLDSELTSLNQYKERLVKIGESVDRTKIDLISNVKERKENYQKRYDIEAKAIKSQLRDIQDNYERDRTMVEDMKNEDLMMARRKLEKDIEEIRKEFDEQCHNVVKEADTKLKDMKQEHDELYEENDKKLKTVERDLKNFMTLIDKKESEGLEQIEDVSRQIFNTKKRFDNLTMTAHSALVKINDWIAIESIPDIRTAIGSSSEVIKKEFPELEALSRIQINVKMTEDEHSPINLTVLSKTNKWYTTGISSSGDGRVVITGPTSVDYQSHITVIDMTGRVLRNDRMKGSAICSYRFCSFFSQFQVATVSWYNEIGVYDVRDGSYSKKNISDIVDSWPSDRYVTCVATDPVNNYILVGSDANADVFVFDTKLNYRYTLTLPQIIEYPEAMAVNKGHLVVCDNAGKKAYVVITDKVDGKLQHSFSEPDFDGDDWSPISICTDKNDFIYILWRRKREVSDEWTCCLLQYSRDGGKTISATPVSSNVRCITTVAMGRSEKLLLAAFETENLYTCSLTETFAFGKK